MAGKIWKDFKGIISEDLKNTEELAIGSWEKVALIMCRPISKTVTCNLECRRGIFALWPNIWSILKNVLCVLEKNVYPVAVGLNFYTCLLGPFGLKYSPSQMFPYWFLSGCSIYYWKCCIKISYYYCIAAYFSLQFCQCLLYIFRCCNVRYIHIYIVASSSWIDPWIM